MKRQIPSLSSLHSLPLSIQMHSDESGLGFVLRALHENYLTLSWLRRISGIYPGFYPESRHAPQIAILTGLPITTVRHLLPARIKDRGMIVRHLYGSSFSLGSFLKGRLPQVCVRCLHSSRYVRRAWEVSVVTCCPRHGLYLVDQCKNCHKQITWDRPAIDTCVCGRYLSYHQSVGFEPSDSELSVASHVESFLSPEDAYTRALTPAWLNGLSLDGLCRLIWAFGISDSDNLRPPTKRSTSSINTHFWIQLLRRFLDRMYLMDQPDSAASLSNHIYKQALDRMSAIGVLHSDREAAIYVLGKVFGLDQIPKATGLNSHLSQKRLFD
ncbi:MAG: TniQ family protein [Betaproteobacteria bacterium]|nr:TniQ family protein [Betaproteobacteria bacterium]